MDNKKDELNEALGAFISRRKMIQMMSFGTAGAAFLPSLLKNAHGQKVASASVPLPLSKPANLIWNYKLPNLSVFINSNFLSPLNFAADPIFYNGTIIICAVFEERGIIYSLDSQTQEHRWSLVNIKGSNLGANFVQPVINDGVIYFANGEDMSQTFYAVDAATGNPLLSVPLDINTSPSFVDGKIILTLFDGNGFNGNIHAVNSENPTEVLWRFRDPTLLAAGGITTLVYRDSILARMNNNIFAIDQETGTELWKTKISGVANGNENLFLSVGNNNVYTVHSDGFLYAFDITTGVQRWKSPATANKGNFTAPVYYNTDVYVADNTGNLYIFESETGALKRAIDVANGGNFSPYKIYIENGIAYLTALSGQETTVYAVDITSQADSMAPNSPPVTYTFLNSYVFGLETGVCYCRTNGSTIQDQIIAVDLAGLVHQFFAESELMVEDYDTSTGKPSTTSYRTHVQLFDPNKNPRLLKSVKVWASEPMTITSGGKSYDIDTAATGKTAWLQTDAAGELSIVSTADTFTSPALYLWGNFMELNEAIVIYPDHDTFNTLSKVKSVALSSAKAYDGTSLFPSTVTDALASVISNTIGAPAAALAATRRQFAVPLNTNPRKNPNLRFTQNTYIAYPGASTNLLYQNVAGSTDRTYVAGNVKQWNATFNVDGSITYNTGLPTKLRLRTVGSFSAFEKFITNVVKGAAKIVHITLDATEAAIHTIYDDATNAYQFAVQTVEQAAQVLAGIFKTVIGDLKKAAQWLSYVFDWDSILANKELIKQKASGGFTKLGTVVDNLFDKEIADVHKFFLNLENSVVSDIQKIKDTIVTDFTGANTPFGSKPLKSQQNAGNNPQLIYGMNGAKSYTKSRWLVSKFKENASQAAIPGLGTDTGNLILTELQKFEKAVIAIIEDPKNGVQTISDDLKQFFSNFSDLITNPSEFVEKSFNDILNVIAEIAVLLLKVVDLVVEGLLELLKAVFDSLLSLVTQTIDIPFISSLYKKISGDDLSVLDLFCLMVAIPGTIILNAANAPTSNVQSLAPETDDLFAVTILLTGLTYAGFDATLDVFNDERIPYQVKLAPLTLSVLLQGMSLPDAIDSSSTDFKLFYAAQAFPVLLTGTDLILSKAEIPRELFDKEAPFALMAYGLGSLIASINLAIQNECGFRGKNYITMTQNIFTFLPYVCKPLGLGGAGSDTNIALGVIDFLCDTTAVSLQFAQILNPNPECT